MTIYRSKDNEMLDEICLSFYGSDKGAVELALEANPHLADLGPRLPANTLIELPDIEINTSTTERTRLWD